MNLWCIFSKRYISTAWKVSVVGVVLVLIFPLSDQVNSEYGLFLRSFQCRSSRPKMFLGKGVQKICIKFTGEHPCRSVISIKLFCNFIEITLRQLVSPFNLLHIFRTLFPKDTSGRLLLKSDCGITFTP